MKVFSNYHPFVIFTYFISCFVITMVTFNPVIIAISLLSSLSYSILLQNKKSFFTSLGYYIPIFILIIIINPLFSHNGKTILFFLNDNPITLEAFYYGIGLAIMVISIIYWFSCYNQIMSSDKLIYLFGKTIPSIGLIISIGLKFIPNLLRQIKQINNVQKTLGLYSNGSFVDRIRNNFRVLSALITWSLENSIDTAMSMKVRGYGLKGRTNFSLFKFRLTDLLFLITNFIVLALFLFGLLNKNFNFYYYPTISKLNFNSINIIIYLVILVFMMTPFIIEIKESIKWRYLKLKI